MWNNLTSGIAQESRSMYLNSKEYIMCETISTVKHTEIKDGMLNVKQPHQ